MSDDDARDDERFENAVQYADDIGISYLRKIIERGLRHLYVRELVKLMAEHLSDDYEQLRKEAEEGEFGDHFPPAGIPGRGD